MKPQAFQDGLTHSSAQAPNPSLAGSADKRLDALRGAVDIRLAALEAALADPEKGDSLEYLILDLARVATEEAQASAARACIDIRLEAELNIAQAQAAARATLDGERAARAETEHALEQARHRIAALDRELAGAKQAALRAADDARAQVHATTVDLERNVGRLERALSDARDEVRSAQTTIEEQRQEFGRAGERLTAVTHELSQTDAARQRLEQDLVAYRDTLGKHERAHVETRQHLEAERRTTAALREEATATANRLAAFAEREDAALAQITRVETELARERQRVAEMGRGRADLESTIVAERATAAGLRQDAQRAADRIAILERQGVDARNEAVRREAESRAAYEQREAEARAVFDRLLAETKAEYTGLDGTGRAARERLAADLAGARAALAELQEGARRLQNDLDAERRTAAQAREAAGQLESRTTAALESERTTVRQLQEIALAAEARAASLGQQVGDALAARDQLAADLNAERLATALLRSDQERLQEQFEVEHATAGELRRQVAAQEARLGALADESHTAARQAREAIARTEAQLALVGKGTQDTIAEHGRIAADLDHERAAAETLRRRQADMQAALDEERAGARALRERLEQVERDAAALLQARVDEATDHAAAGQREQTEELQRRLAALEGDNAQALAARADVQDALGHARAEVQFLRDDLERARGRIEALAAGRADHERAWRDTEAQLRLMTQDRDELAARLETANFSGVAPIAEMQARTDAASTLVPSATPLRVLPSPAYRGTQGKPAGRATTGSKPVRGRDRSLENEWVSVRLAPRYRLHPPIEVDVSGKTGLLCDLSAGGCQILSSAPLRPKQPVKVTLRADPAALVCTGTVVWANLEAAGPGRPGGYRAGVQFSHPDETAIEAFVVSHGATA